MLLLEIKEPSNWPHWSHWTWRRPCFPASTIATSGWPRFSARGVGLALITPASPTTTSKAVATICTNRASTTYPYALSALTSWAASNRRHRLGTTTATPSTCTGLRWTAANFANSTWTNCTKLHGRDGCHFISSHAASHRLITKMARCIFTTSSSHGLKQSIPELRNVYGLGKVDKVCLFVAKLDRGVFFVVKKIILLICKLLISTKTSNFTKTDVI